MLRLGKSGKIPGMKRSYETLISDSLARNRQLAMVSGARQVGKTTIVRNALPRARYFNYDNTSDVPTILAGPRTVAEVADLANPLNVRKGIIFDEIHKFPKWKSFLKGFFDVYGNGLKIAMTGSARLNIYKRGGDSLMGRYFLYRIHPLSAAEVASPAVDLEEVFQKPKKVSLESINLLLRFGGFPEPFLHGTMRFYNKWKNLRLEQLFTEDLRDLSRVQDIRRIGALAELLRARVTSGVNYSSLASDLTVTADTVKSWITLLESVYYCYSVQPWFQNIANSIRKQPKIYLWDWSVIDNPGAKNENFVASHLLKSAHWWTDNGLGASDLFYLRDKQQREVDFLVTRDRKPFLLVECKSSGAAPVSQSLGYFQQVLHVPYAFQVAFDMPPSDILPTDYPTPVKISIADLLKILL